MSQHEDDSFTVLEPIRLGPFEGDAEVLDVSTSYQFTTGQLMLVIGTERESTEYIVHPQGYFSIDLEKDNGDIYEVRKVGKMVSCTCKAYQFRYGPRGVKCKHGRALLLAGLLR